MNRNKLVEVCRQTTIKNSLNEVVKQDEVVDFTCDMVISVKTGNTQSVMNVLAAHSTHTGITSNTDITTKHIIKDGDTRFAIDYITPLPRGLMLDLRLVQEL